MQNVGLEGVIERLSVLKHPRELLEIFDPEIGVTRKLFFERIAR